MSMRQRFLPADDISDGFDNISNVLKVSPSFLDQYITAARAVTIQALGTPMLEEAQRVTLRGGSNGSESVCSRRHSPRA